MLEVCFLSPENSGTSDERADDISNYFIVLILQKQKCFKIKHASQDELDSFEKCSRIFNIKVPSKFLNFTVTT